jgi:hypothetical protein
MNDPAVVAGLMAGELGLFLEDHEADARSSLEEAHRSRHPDDPAADHAVVQMYGHHPDLRSGRWRQDEPATR